MRLRRYARPLTILVALFVVAVVLIRLELPFNVMSVLLACMGLVMVFPRKWEVWLAVCVLGGLAVRSHYDDAKKLETTTRDIRVEFNSKLDTNQARADSLGNVRQDRNDRRFDEIAMLFPAARQTAEAIKVEQAGRNMAGNLKELLDHWEERGPQIDHAIVGGVPIPIDRMVVQYQDRYERSVSTIVQDFRRFGVVDSALDKLIETHQDRTTIHETADRLEGLGDRLASRLRLAGQR